VHWGDEVKRYEPKSPFVTYVMERTPAAVLH
jgi:hypothetical protein